MALFRQRAKLGSQKPYLGACSWRRVVKTDATIDVHGNSYSVPYKLIGKTVEATVVNDQLRITLAGEVISCHEVAEAGSGAKRRKMYPCRPSQGCHAPLGRRRQGCRGFGVNSCDCDWRLGAAEAAERVRRPIFHRACDGSSVRTLRASVGCGMILGGATRRRAIPRADLLSQSLDQQVTARLATP